MPKHLADLVQRCTLVKHGGRQAVAKKVGSLPCRFHSGLLQSTTGNTTDIRRGQRTDVGCNRTDENIAASA